MATDRSTNQPDTPAPGEPSAHISPAMRKRLQRCYDRGNEVIKQDKPDYDYAHTMFSECVVHDPANLEYAEAMLDNLQRKYKNNRRGARLKGFGGRGHFKKIVASEDWPEVFLQGVDLLKTNPWDVPTLRAIAHACEVNHYNEAELRYLKNALDANPKDLDVNRHCAESLARMGQFDQAIACWHRIEELKKDNDEARKKISELTLAKARGVPGIETTSSGRSTPRSSSSSAAPSKSGKSAGSPSAPKATETEDEAAPDQAVSIEALELAVSSDEADLDRYVELAEAYTEAGRFRDAYQTLKRALEASGGNNLAIREQLEDAQIRMVRAQVGIAEQRAAADKTEEAAGLVKRFRAELNRQELQVFSNRTDRYPDDLKLKFELGIRLKRDGNYHQARHVFEAARAEPDLRAVATLEMGEAFQHLKQYGNAIKCYQSAASEAVAGSDTHLLALYRIGVLAAALKNLEAAAESLETLLGLDPDYRDAQARLDKLQQIRDKE